MLLVTIIKVCYHLHISNNTEELDRNLSITLLYLMQATRAFLNIRASFVDIVFYAIKISFIDHKLHVIFV